MPITFDVDFTASSTVFNVDFTASSAVFDAAFEALQVVIDSDLPVFSGPYDVTPKWSQQKMETSGKQMRSDVTVLEIPYQFVSNPRGGITVTIGG